MTASGHANYTGILPTQNPSFRIGHSPHSYALGCRLVLTPSLCWPNLLPFQSLHLRRPYHAKVDRLPHVPNRTARALSPHPQSDQSDDCKNQVHFFYKRKIRSPLAQADRIRHRPEADSERIRRRISTAGASLFICYLMGLEETLHLPCDNTCGQWPWAISMPFNFLRNIADS